MVVCRKEIENLRGGAVQLFKSFVSYKFELNFGRNEGFWGRSCP